MRVADAPLIAPYALNLVRRVVIFGSTDSNSHGFAFSRRDASEVCQSLANRARGWSVGRRQGCCVRHPLEADQWTHLARQGDRARPKVGAAPPSAPPAIRPVGWSGAPVQPALALSAEGSLLESALHRTELAIYTAL